MNQWRHILMVGACMAWAPAVVALSLTEAVSRTLDTHPEIQAARHQLNSRNEEVRLAKAGYLPSVDVAAGIGRETIDTPANDEVSLTRQEASLAARQMLFDGFATSEEVSRQSARYHSALHSLRATEEGVILRVAEVYLNLLRQSELLDLARSTLYEHQNIHDQMVLRNKSGVGSRADLNQITARLALSHSNMVTVQSNLIDAQTNFYRVTGIEPQLNILSEPQIKQVLPVSQANAERLALQQHPTLQSAGADVNSAVAQYETSKSAFWPRLQLEADKSWDENIAGIEGDNEDLVVAVRMTYNLYSGGGDSARRRQTAHLLEEAREVRNNTSRQVVESLRLSWTAFSAIRDQMKYLELHVRAAQDTRTAYQQQFNIGRRTLLDLLNTENELVDARRALINAGYDQLFAQYRIFNSMGQLLPEFADTRS